MYLNIGEMLGGFIKGISGKKNVLKKKNNPFLEDFDNGGKKDGKQIYKYNITDENTKFSSVIASISLSVGIIIGGAGMSIIGQVLPDSTIQEISSKITKIISEDKTGYEIIKENGKNILIIKEQGEVIELYKKIQSYQEEILLERKKQIEIYNGMLSNILDKNTSKKDDVKSFDNNSNKGEKELSKKIEVKKTVDNSEIYKIVSNSVKEIKSNLPDGFEIKIQEQIGGRILVWTEFDGKKSIGYYADSPKFKDRLSKDAIKNWANNRYNNLLTIKQIENIALERQIALSKNNTKTPIYIEIKELYSGDIKVSLYDRSIKKSGSFLVNSKKDTSYIISPKIDSIVNDFLS